jgi:hypothetical protein
MKKILFTLCALILGLSAHAQTKGNIVIGGSLELSTTGTKTSITHSGSTTTTEGDGEFMGGIGVNGGYFINDNILIGVGLGYNGTSEEDGTDINRQNIFQLAPYASYYVKLSDKFYYTPTVKLGFEFAGNNTLDTTDGSINNQISAFGIDLTFKPAAFEYRANEKIALGLSLGDLTFGHMTAKPKNDNSITFSSNAFDVNIMPGINFTMKFYIK